VVAAGLTLRHRAVFGAVTEAGRAATPAAIHDPDPSPTEPSEVEDAAPRSPAVRGLKVAFDVTAAALGLLLLSPLLLLIALLIKLESKGPVFYGDRREGQGGRVFRCLKFRTMFAGADAQQRELLAKNEVDGPQFKLAHDPAVTALGRVLRKLSLDELPQLVNVRAPRDEPRRARGRRPSGRTSSASPGGRPGCPCGRASRGCGRSAGTAARRATSISGSTSTCSTSSTRHSSSTSRYSPPPS
jgi:hypothetical protein